MSSSEYWRINLKWNPSFFHLQRVLFCDTFVSRCSVLMGICHGELCLNLPQICLVMTHYCYLSFSEAVTLVLTYLNVNQAATEWFSPVCLLPESCLVTNTRGCFSDSNNGIISVPFWVCVGGGTPHQNDRSLLFYYFFVDRDFFSVYLLNSWNHICLWSLFTLFSFQLNSIYNIQLFIFQCFGFIFDTW